MGNYVNKLFFHNNDEPEGKTQASTEEENFEENMHTPITQRNLPVDPRSETVGIERTPIEVLQVNCTPLHGNKRISAIPKHLQTKLYLETDIDKVMPLLTPKKAKVEREETTPKLENSLDNYYSELCLKPTVNYATFPRRLTSTQKARLNVLGLDPRSPAADFDRTPILRPKSIERLNARHQEILNRRGSYETDMYSKFLYCETSSLFDVPEIQILPNGNSCQGQFSDMLNHIDNLEKSYSPSSSLSSRTDTASETGEDNSFNENNDIMNKGMNLNNDLIRQQIFAEQRFETANLRQDILDIEKNMQCKHMYTNDNDRIRIWRDSLTSENAENADLVESDNTEIVENKTTRKEEVIITFDDNDHQKKIELVGKKKKSRKSDIRITADEKKTFNSDDKINNETLKVRTPLGNRSNNGQKKTLLTKSPQMLRNKSALPKVLQENTPPHKRNVAKSKLNGMHWDPNSTVII